MYCNVDLFNITLWNEPMVWCKRYETPVYLVTNSSFAPHTHKPAVHQPAFRYHPTPAEPHQYTSAHRNRYVITFAYDKRTHPGHIIITRTAPIHKCTPKQVRDNFRIQQKNTSRTHYNNTHRTNKPTKIHYQTNKTLMHKHLPLQTSTHTYSRQLLSMNLVAFETCWEIINFHKVTSSTFNLFIC
jgi:hypothetical protein